MDAYQHAMKSGMESYGVAAALQSTNKGNRYLLILLFAVFTVLPCL